MNDSKTLINYGRDCLQRTAQNWSGAGIPLQSVRCFESMNQGVNILSELINKYKSYRAIRALIGEVDYRLKLFEENNTGGKIDEVIKKLKGQKKELESKLEKSIIY